MTSKTWTVAKVYTVKDPIARCVRLENAGPPPEYLIITDLSSDEWVLVNAAFGSTVTVTTDAAGNRSGISRP